MAGPGKVNYETLYRDSIPVPQGCTAEQLESERGLAHLMLSEAERRRLVEISPECAYVMGIKL